MLEKRTLAPLEHVLELFNQLAASFNIVTISRIRGPLDGNVLEKAIHLTQQRHPLLNYSIHGELNGQLRLHPHNATALPLTVIQGQANDWQAAVVAELNTKMPSHLSLMRVVLVTQPETQTHHLITTLHHTIADGLSALHLHRDILTYCHQLSVMQSPLTIEALPIQPSVETLMPAAYQGFWGTLKSFLFLLKLQFQYLYYQPQTLAFEKTVEVAARRCGFIRRELSPEMTTQLVHRCRQEKTTVQGVLCAAMLLSVASFLRTPQRPQVVAVCRSYTDIRRRLPTPVGYQHLACLAGAIASFHRIAPEVSLWDLARDARHQIQKGLAKGEDFYIVRRAKNVTESLLAKPNQAPITVEITNAGRIDIPTTYGNLVLEDISYCLPQALFGPVYTATATTFSDKMVLNFMYSQPSISEQTIKTLSEETMNRIVAALSS